MAHTALSTLVLLLLAASFLHHHPTIAFTTKPTTTTRQPFMLGSGLRHLLSRQTLVQSHTPTHTQLYMQMHTHLTPTKQIAIIGAGAAGLAAARAFLRRLDDDTNHNGDDDNPRIDFQVSVLEMRSSLGGIWDYNDETEGRKHTKSRPMYQQLRTNLPKELMAFREFPWGDGNNDNDGGTREESYVSHRKVQRYLEDYAEEFGLKQCIRFGCTVEQLTVLNHDDDDNDENNEAENHDNKANHKSNNNNNVEWPRISLQWKEVKENNTILTQRQTFDTVCICNGHYSLPSIPALRGLSSFRGRILHAIQYDQPDEFTNQTVLCVGARASGMDIAREIASVARVVYLSDSTCRERKEFGKVVCMPRTSWVDDEGGVHFSSGEGESEEEVVYRIDVFFFVRGMITTFPSLMRILIWTCNSYRERGESCHFLNSCGMRGICRCRLLVFPIPWCRSHALHNNQGTSARKAAAKRKQNNLRLNAHQGISRDIDSEIEDVTDQYVKKKQIRPTPPEIIKVEDVSSDEESCSGLKMRSSDARSVDKTNGAVHDKEHGQEKDVTEEERSSDGNDDSESDIEDVTECMLAKRKEELLEVLSGAIDLVHTDNEDAVDHGSTPSRARRRRANLDPPIEVLIAEEDIPACPGEKCTAGRGDESKYSGDEDFPGENNVDHTIKQRIIKLLNTGFHAESNENEARNAMKLARRLMERYNLDQCVLLQERGDGSLNDFSTTNDETNCPSALRGGIVDVSIRNRKKGTALTSLPRWMDFLAQPICANFHVDAFKSISRATKYKKGECTISFYGIKTNAQLAAYAYKISTERISLMAASYELPVGYKTSAVRTARLSYALGIVDGLDSDVKKGSRKEEKRRKSKLNKARRSAHLTLDQLECENTAQLALIDHQKRIAEDILKSNDVEVRAGRKCKSVSVDIDAYEKGIVDSKEIDLNQQAIGDT